MIGFFPPYGARHVVIDIINLFGIDRIEGLLRTNFRSGLGVVAAVVLTYSLTVTTSASAEPAIPRSAPSLTAVKQHLARFQQIVDANGGARASGTPGFEASRDYVATKLKSYGYKVTVQPFEFPFFQEKSTAVLRQTSPDAKVYTPTPT